MNLFSRALLLAALACLGCPKGPPKAAPPKAAKARPAQPARPAPPKLKPGYGKLGSVNQYGVRFPVEAVVAVWNAKDAKFKLTLLCFEPSAAEVLKLRRGEAFSVVSDRKSPDPQVFPGRMPLVELSFSWPFTKKAPGGLKTSSVHLYLGGIPKKGANLNLNFALRFEKGTWDFKGKHDQAGSKYSFKIKSEHDFMKKPVTLDLDLKGTILAPPPAPKPPPLKPEDRGACGVVTRVQSILPMSDCVATWNPKARSLRACFLPFQPKPPEIALFQAGRFLYSPKGLRARKALFPKRFPGRTPVVVLDLRWEKPKQIGDPATCQGHMQAFALEAKHRSRTVFLKRKQLKLKGKLAAGETVELSYTGQEVTEGVLTTWELKARVKLLPDKRPKR